jgi:hypothetical protein
VYTCVDTSYCAEPAFLGFPTSMLDSKIPTVFCCAKREIEQNIKRLQSKERMMI